jgi:hypothetical protein
MDKVKERRLSLNHKPTSQPFRAEFVRNNFGNGRVVQMYKDQQPKSLQRTFRTPTYVNLKNAIFLAY